MRWNYLGIWRIKTPFKEVKNIAYKYGQCLKIMSTQPEQGHL